MVRQSVRDVWATFCGLLRHISVRNRVRVRYFAVISFVPPQDASVGYVDESNGPDGDVLSVAITVASIVGWERWGKGWLPKIHGLKGGYRAQKHKSLHPALADLMVKHTEFSSFINLRESDYHEFFQKWVQSLFGGAYVSSVLFTLSTAAQWTREENRGRIFYFVEQGHRNFQHLAFLLSVIARSEELRGIFGMAGWGAATKEDIPTHCPDTLAHCAATHYGAKSYGTFIDTLYKAEKVWRGNYTRELIKESVPRFAEIARVLRRAMRDERKRREFERRQSRKRQKD